MATRDPRRLLVTALCGFCAVGLPASSAPPNASEFYIVSVGFSDAVPGWHHSVLEVTPDGADVRVRYIRVAPFSADCGTASRIGASEARLPNTVLNVVTGGVNVCAMDGPSLRRAIRAFPQRPPRRAFAGNLYGIVAKCGTEVRVIRLPGDWEVDMARLKRKRPQVAALWSLENRVGTRAFGRFPFLDTVPTETAARLQPASEAVLSELRSGKFDAGLAPRSFRDDVAALRPLSKEVASVRLRNAGRYRFEHYVNPQYPLLARQAQIGGTVELEVTSNSITGETAEVALVSGNPILEKAALDAARQWRFPPGTETALRAARVVLEFEFDCP